MKNFARITDLGAGECCVHRRGTHELVFDFWMRLDDQVLSPSVTKIYDVSWVLDSIFGGDHEEVLKQACQDVLDVVLHQMAIHEEQLEENIPLVLDGNTLDKIYRADAD